jgi:hypothetical protein
MTTPDNAKHVGILLGKKIDSIMEAAMAHIEQKAIRDV